MLRNADLDDVTPKKIAGYEKTFTTTYRTKKNPKRSVVAVEKVSEEQTSSGVGAGELNVFFDVTLKCKKCNSNATLFVKSSSTSRTLLLENDPENTNHHDESIGAVTTYDQNNEAIAPRHLAGSFFTAELFTKNFNIVLPKVAKELKVQLKPALRWTELFQLPCSNNVVNLDTILIIDCLGEADLLTANELDIFAQATLDTVNSLNRLNEETCDPLFRVALSADAELLNPDTNDRRNLQVIKKFFKVKVIVKYTCRGCGKNTNLVKNDASRRRMLEFHSHNDGFRRGLQLSAGDEDCYCLTGATDFREATRGEFNAAFKETIAELVNDGSLTSITDVGSLIEVEERDCPNVASLERETTFKLMACGADGYLEKDEIDLAASAIRSSLDELFLLFCGDSSRIITDVTYITYFESGSCDSVQYFFLVSFKCNSCGEGSKLLASSISSRVHSSVWEVGAPTSDGETCFCDVDAIDNRLPTINEVCSIDV